jgi:AcrR family transcriptional regulator
MARPRKRLDLSTVAETLVAPRVKSLTMEQIAAEMNLAKATLYRMAGSREELIGLCVDAEAEHLLERIREGGAQGLLRFAEESPSGFLLLFGGRYPEARMAVRRVENRFAETLRRESQASDRGPADMTLLAAGLFGLAAGIARRAAEDGASIGDSELVRSVFDDVAKAASRISDSMT